jgi:UPF0755 protein
MSVRDGRGPRGPVRYDSNAFDESRYPVQPPYRKRGGPSGPRRGSSIGGVLRFLVFALVLAGVVLASLLTILRPLARSVVYDWAWDNPGSMRIGIVADFVSEELGDALTKAASTASTEEIFEVEAGDTPNSIAPRLVDEGFLPEGTQSERAFLFRAIRANLAPNLQAGLVLLRKDMTPQELVEGLVGSRLVLRTEDVTFREQLRLEQITAQLQTVTSSVDPQAFYDLAKHPPAALLADYPWVQIPEGGSLEGYLYPATYTFVLEASGGPFKVTTADGLVRMMLDTFRDRVGEARMNVPESRGLTWYQVLSLASIVEREAVLDEERPIIAGVYQNRIAGLHGIAKILNADPTVVYAVDTMNLEDEIQFGQWQQYFFWSVPQGKALKDIAVRDDLQGFQTYQVGGLIPAPICTPSAASIDGALNPNIEDGFLYFVAIPDGGGRHAFAKTFAEHQQNLRKYGYL